MQVFSPAAVVLLKTGLGIGAVAVVMAVAVWRTANSPQPALETPVEQIVPFSHKHHVAEDGIDCRYCHSTVETSAFAGIPPLSTCMTCHSQIYADAPVLAPLRDAYVGERAFAWRRVYDLPDFVYFDHSIHLAKGVGCSTCHGRVDQMPLTARVASLRMQWCLDCHRAPERFLRAPDEVFDMSWRAPPDQDARGRRLAAEYHLQTTALLTSCSTCHR